jgi:UDP-glucuronate 4-epimerase
MTTSNGTSPSESPRYLITGALGCIGAWTVATLIRRGAQVVAFDLGSDSRRVRQLTTPEEFGAVTFVQGDITKLDSVERALDEYGITNVIHLAALQVPFCRANPPLGALVNVVGTVNIFDAVSRRADRIGPVVYAGSVGMFSATDVDPATGRLEQNTVAHPVNHYGVYKQANEATAGIYWRENGIASIGLRPMTVFGMGRDQGITSGPTKAILAAVLGQQYEIGFGGKTLFNYADDVARALVLASRSNVRGVLTFNLSGSLARVHDFVTTLQDVVPESAGLIRAADEALPFPEEISDAGLDTIGDMQVTPLEVAIRTTVELFRSRLADGRLRPEEYGLQPAGRE